jgi:hypothetical protein
VRIKDTKFPSAGLPNLIYVNLTKSDTQILLQVCPVVLISDKYFNNVPSENRYTMCVISKTSPGKKKRNLQSENENAPMI